MEMREQRQDDLPGIEHLMDAAFGPRRGDRAVWRLRPGPPVPELCLVAEDNGVLVGSLRFWQVQIFDRPQLLLGPLAVQPELRGKGHGKALVWHGLAIASQGSWDFCIISGEPDYYPRFGFVPVPAGQLVWPGFLEPGRLQIKPLKSAEMPPLPPGPAAILPDHGPPLAVRPASPLQETA